MKVIVAIVLLAAGLYFYSPYRTKLLIGMTPTKAERDHYLASSDDTFKAGATKRGWFFDSKYVRIEAGLHPDMKPDIASSGYYFNSSSCTHCKLSTDILTQFKHLKPRKIYDMLKGSEPYIAHLSDINSVTWFFVNGTFFMFSDELRFYYFRGRRMFQIDNKRFILDKTKKLVFQVDRRGRVSKPVISKI